MIITKITLSPTTCNLCGGTSTEFVEIEKLITTKVCNECAKNILKGFNVILYTEVESATIKD